MSANVVIKLVNGTELFGRIDLDADSSKLLIVEDPMVTEEIYSDDGSVGSMLIKFCSATDENSMGILTTSILSIASMSEAFIGYYEAAVKMAVQTQKAYNKKISAIAEQMEFILYSHSSEHEPVQILDTDSDTIH